MLAIAESIRFDGRSAYSCERTVATQMTTGSMRWALVLKECLRDIHADVTYSVRLARRDISGALVSIAILAFGVGANTAVYTLVDAALLNPLPYPDPGRIISIGLSPKYRTDFNGGLDVDAFVALSDASAAFESVALYAGPTQRTVQFGGVELDTTVSSVSPSMFHLLHARPTIGRVFTAVDISQRNAVALIGYELWLRYFNANPAVVGTEIKVASESYTVVGVLVKDFRFPRATTNIWLPLVPRSGTLYPALGRLENHVDIQVAHAEVSQRAGNLLRTGDFALRLVPFGDQLNSSTRPAVLSLQAAVVLLLLVAAASAGQLMAARIGRRAGEFSTRAALGATRGRLVRQALTEVAGISIVGLAAGVLLAFWGTRLLVALLPAKLWLEQPIGPHIGVVGFTISVSATIIALVGALPSAISSGVFSSVRRTTPFFSTRKRQGAAFVVVAIVSCCPLIAIAFIVLRSVSLMAFSDPGCDPSGVVMAHVRPSPAAVAEIGASLRSTPGISSVAFSSVVPLAPRSMRTVYVEGMPRNVSVETDYAYVTWDYFSTLRMRVQAGRLPVKNGDTREVVVNSTFARRYLTLGSTVGARLNDSFTVIGIVQDVRDRGLSMEVPPIVYYAAELQPNALRYMIVRSELGDRRTSDVLTAIIVAVNGKADDANVSSLGTAFARSIALERFQAIVLSVLGGIGLALVAIGIYGVVAHSVARRTRELSIRVALGARRGDVVRMVIRNHLGMSTFGVILGLLCAIVVSRLVSAMVIPVGTLDIVTASLVSCAIILATTLTSTMAAIRATHIEPATALRYD